MNEITEVLQQVTTIHYIAVRYLTHCAIHYGTPLILLSLMCPY
jgi:hypothetical protein